jgi:hypothetical protein
VVTCSKHWRIQLFGEPATAAPSRFFFLFFLNRNEKKKSFTALNRLRKLFFDHDRRPLRQTAIPPLIFWIRPWF